MIDLLLDTNVMMYIYDQHPTYLDFLRSTGEKALGVSVVTCIEMLVGVRSDEEEKATREFLDDFEVIPLNTKIAEASARWMRRRKIRNLKHHHFADTIIGHTAVALGVPLVTNNPKDFAGFTGLKTIVP